MKVLLIEMNKREWTLVGRKRNDGLAKSFQALFYVIPVLASILLIASSFWHGEEDSTFLIK